MKYPDPKLRVRKTGINRPTPQNLQEVAEQTRAVVLELHGVVGPEQLRAVRLQELLRAGVVKVSADGTLVASDTTAVNAVSGDKTYRHVQGAASDSWTVVHGLGKFPAVFVVDSAGTLVDGDVAYIDQNTVVVTFSSPFSGEAYFN